MSDRTIITRSHMGSRHARSLLPPLPSSLSCSFARRGAILLPMLSISAVGSYLSGLLLRKMSPSNRTLDGRPRAPVGGGWGGVTNIQLIQQPVPSPRQNALQRAGPLFFLHNTSTELNDPQTTRTHLVCGHHANIAFCLGRMSHEQASSPASCSVGITPRSYPFCINATLRKS